MDIAVPLLAMVHMTYICEAGKSPYIICIISFFKTGNSSVVGVSRTLR